MQCFPAFPRRAVATALQILGVGACVFAMQAQAQTIPEGADHATQKLNNAWDMASQSDVFPLLWTHNLAAATVSNGVMNATPRDSDPHFWLQFPPIPSAFVPPNLAQAPIDANTYTRLSFLMWLPESTLPGSSNGRLVWHKGGSTVAAFDAAYSESALFPVYPGWHLYDFDLAALTPSKGSAWAGELFGLRIDPCVGCAVPFKMDWARLYHDKSASASITIPSGKTHVLAQVLPTGSTNPVTTVLPAASGMVSVARLPAGSYQIAPFADVDYGLTQRGKAWDFSVLSDTLVTSGINVVSVDSKGLTASTNNPDPFILLDVPNLRPIDASKYRHIAIDMTLTNVPDQESGLVVWWGDAPATVRHPSAFTPVQQGRKTYRIDLGNSANWQGLVKALRIDPLNGPNAAGGFAFTLHGVTLTTTSGAQETLTFNSQPLVINARPTVQIVSPGFTTGDDYALVEQGKSWLLNKDQVKQPTLSNLAGWEYVTQIPEINAMGQFFHASSLPAAPGHTEGDPQAFLVFQENTKPIAADTYRWLGFDLYVPMDAASQDELTKGAVGRVAWKKDDTDPGLTTDDIVLMPGLQRYWLDMSKVVYEPASTRTWTGQIRYLRIDPLEFPTPRHFYVGRTELRSTPMSQYILPLTLALNDADGDAMSVTVRAGSTVITTAQGLKNGTHSLFASVGGLPAGEHSLTVEVSDGKSNITRQAEVSFMKLPMGSGVPAHQITAADRIFQWAEVLTGGTLGTPTPSTMNPTCPAGVPGSYGRYYPASKSCLLVLDGLIVYSLNGQPLALAGTTDGLLAQAAAAGF
jgi:hypothetical protein